MKLRNWMLGATSVLALLFAGGHATHAGDVVTAADASNSWTGPRVGIVGGYGWGKADYEGTGLLAEDESGSVDIQGAMLGGLIGYDYGLSNGLVVGVVGDLSWLNLEGSDCQGLAGCEYELQTEIDALGTLRGRIGFGLDNLLVYGTGGLAVGHVDVSVEGYDGSDSKTMYGWTGGAGVEYRISDPVTIGIEYLYIDLGESEFDFGSGTGVDVGVTSQAVRGSLNFKF
ncbi:outer membrane protein [Aestuariivirga sp.]|jgi:outer membrane immunogenic protein|uniref:outer membrane protein n=1 Tax=Aestuariivirga sp. TaxID=2650926 RepID=UPI0037831079